MLLRALARFRLARTRDLTELVFAGVRRDTATARIRRLFDAGYLNVKFRDRAEENIYTLGPKGRAWLEEQGISLGRIPRGDPTHHLAVVRAWASMAVAAYKDDHFTIERVRPDWEIREHVGRWNAAIIPDALMMGKFAPEDGGVVRVRFALEVDLGTETISVLGKKIAMYEKHRVGEGLFGWRDFGLVIRLIGATPGRRHRVESLLDERWGSWSVIWYDPDGTADVLDRIKSAASPSTHGLPLRQGDSSGRM